MNCKSPEATAASQSWISRASGDLEPAVTAGPSGHDEPCGAPRPSDSAWRVLVERGGIRSILSAAKDTRAGS